ncbi:MAG: NosD domain-containing protein [Candidatus Woesearchaeota archaeon]
MLAGNAFLNQPTLSFRRISLFIAFLLLAASAAAEQYSVSGCQNLSVGNSTYTLQVSISSNSTCLSINASNVTIDCSGFNISYGTNSSGYGIHVQNANSTVIKNCAIIKSGSEGDSNYGIFVELSNDTVIINNSVSTNGSGSNHGLSFHNSSYANVTSNVISTNGSGDGNSGIYIENSDGILVSNNSISTNGNGLNDGISILNDSFVNISSNALSASGLGDENIGIRAELSNNVLIGNNSISTGGSSMNYGLWLYRSSYMSVASNIISTNGTADDNFGIYLQESSSSNISLNTIYPGGTENNICIIIQTGSNNNILSRNFLFLGGARWDYGIYLYDRSGFNSISRNVITNSGGVENNGIFFEGNNLYNNITGNNITTSGNSSSGIVLIDSNSTMVSGNIIKTEGNLSFAVSIASSNSSSSNNTIYNNIFNTTEIPISILDNSYSNNFSTTPYPGTNIAGGAMKGGNFYDNSTPDSGFRHSLNCTDLGIDGFCDSPYIFDGNNTDFYPLSDDFNLSLPIGVASCVEFPEPNRDYYLLNDIEVDFGIWDYCFKVWDTTNITLDCRGHSITNINEAQTGIAFDAYPDQFWIVDDSSYVRINNCTISNFGYGFDTYGSVTNSRFEANEVAIVMDARTQEDGPQIGGAGLVENNTIILGTRTASPTHTYAFGLAEGIDKYGKPWIVRNNVITGSVSETGGSVWSFWAEGVGGMNGSAYIYNNTFNASQTFATESGWNWFPSSEAAQYWNDSMGGNYWGNGQGNGYAETCTDTDVNGICDLPFDLQTQEGCIIGVSCGTQVDYLPLSDRINDESDEGDGIEGNGKGSNRGGRSGGGAISRIGVNKKPGSTGELPRPKPAPLPQPTPTTGIPTQLFDIRLNLEENVLYDSRNLTAWVTFESFGSGPTPVNLTYIVLDESGNEVYTKKAAVMVYTEEFVRETFDQLDIGLGNYELVLKTLYNSNVTDEFRQGFKIVEAKKVAQGYRADVMWWIILLICLFFPLTSECSEILRRKKSGENVHKSGLMITLALIVLTTAIFVLNIFNSLPGWFYYLFSVVVFASIYLVFKKQAKRELQLEKALQQGNPKSLDRGITLYNRQVPKRPWWTLR